MTRGLTGPSEMFLRVQSVKTCLTCFPTYKGAYRLDNVPQVILIKTYSIKNKEYGHLHISVRRS